MAQKHAGKKGGRPPSQAHWRRNVSDKSIAITKQQIEKCCQRLYGRCSVKHNKERIFPNLFVHERMTLQFTYSSGSAFSVTKQATILISKILVPFLNLVSIKIL